MHTSHTNRMAGFCTNLHGQAARVGATFLVAAMVACAPGCGSQRSSSGRAASASNPLVVHLAYFPNVTHAPALVGTERGMFAEALGPQVRIDEQSFAAGPSEIEGVFAGQVDIGYIGPGPAINGFAKSHGEALKVIAGAASGGSALVVRADSGITDIKGLAGKRVAVPQIGGTQDISLRHNLQMNGLASPDRGGNVTVLGTAPADTLSLFVRKDLEAAWVTEPWVSRLVNEGNGRVLVDERDLWPNRKYATTIVIVRTEFQRQHPDVVARFLEAHIRAVDWIASHHNEAAAVVGSRLKKLTGKALAPDVLQGSLSRTEFMVDPLQESILAFAEWSRALGYQRLDRAGLSGLVDLQPLNAALAKAGRPALK